MAQEETFHSTRKHKPDLQALAGKENRMKKYRKLISLMLAFVMVFSFMAMSASAATTEVQPRGTCPQCINGYVETTKSPSSTKYGHYQTTCSRMSVMHQHYKQRFLIETTCRNCGYYDSYNPELDCCIYAG